MSIFSISFSFTFVSLGFLSLKLILNCPYSSYDRKAGRQAGSHSVMQLTDVKAAQKEERDICSNAQTNKGPRYLKKTHTLLYNIHMHGRKHGYQKDGSQTNQTRKNHRSQSHSIV